MAAGSVVPENCGQIRRLNCGGYGGSGNEVRGKARSGQQAKEGQSGKLKMAQVPRLGTYLLRYLIMVIRPLGR